MDRSHSPARRLIPTVLVTVLVMACMLLLGLTTACNGPEPAASPAAPTATADTASGGNETALPSEGADEGTPGNPAPTGTVGTTGPTLPVGTGPGDVSIPDMAWQALRDGDYALAAPLFMDAMEVAAESEANRLRLGLGRTYLGNAQYRDAAAILAQVDADALEHEEALVALGSLAEAYASAGMWEEAIETYRHLLATDDSAAHVVHLEIAKAYRALDRDADAASELQAVDLTNLSNAERATVLEELASILEELEDYEAAAATYDSVLTFAQYAGYRSLLLQKKGNALLEAGRTEDARQVLREVIDLYPTQSGAYLALMALDDLDDSAVSDLSRGVVLYHAWQYDASLSALRRYQLGYPDGILDKAHYYTGLASEALGQHSQAIIEFDRVIDYYPQSAYLASAWMAKGSSLSALGEDASDWYAEFAATYPDSGRAAEALWLAAENREAKEDWGGAGVYYRQLADVYAHDTGASEARFREGLVAYAAGDYESARTVWMAALDVTPGELVSARLLTWLGLVSRRVGDEQAAIDYWMSAIERDPESYYGLRARDLVTGVGLVLSAQVPSEVGDSTVSAEDWQEITLWVQSWAQADPSQVDDLTSSSLVRRAMTEWTLGAHADATDALVLFRQNIADDPHALVAFARLCDDYGITPMSIWAADRLHGLGRAAGMGAPPLGLYKLAYPTDYGHLISAECERYAVDSSLFLALVRQESRFDPRSQSWVGALGLTQVMPATGQDIAAALGLSDYRHDLLTRPVVSVRFGVFYLAQMLNLCDRDWIAAIASYNGGYGNVSSWTRLPIPDHDLFYEMIPFEETKAYIRLLYTNYRLYEAIYP